MPAWNIASNRKDEHLNARLRRPIADGLSVAECLLPRRREERLTFRRFLMRPSRNWLRISAIIDGRADMKCSIHRRGQGMLELAPESGHSRCRAHRRGGTACAKNPDMWRQWRWFLFAVFVQAHPRIRAVRVTAQAGSCSILADSTMNSISCKFPIN